MGSRRCLSAAASCRMVVALLPHPVAYAPYSASHVVMQLQLLGFAALVFYLLRGQLKPQPGRTLDLDWFYRRPGTWLVRGFDDATGAVWQALVSGVSWNAIRLQERLYRLHNPTVPWAQLPTAPWRSDTLLLVPSCCWRLSR